jgi:short-subunit dehydrogenase involved in D-alanine esterification of teichoic acids
MTIEFVLALRDQLKDGKIDVREIVPVKETEEELEEDAQPVERDYEELRVKTLEALNTVRKVSLSLKRWSRRANPSAAIRPSKSNTRNSSIRPVSRSWTRSSR